MSASMICGFLFAIIIVGICGNAFCIPWNFVFDIVVGVYIAYLVAQSEASNRRRT
jgi:hypothetical protein